MVHRRSPARRVWIPLGNPRYQKRWLFQPRQLRLADQLRKISEASAVGVLVENPMETPSSWYRIHSQLVFNGYFFRGTALKTFTYQFVVSSDDDVPTDQLPKFMLTSMLLDGRRNMHGFVRILGTPLDMLRPFWSEAAQGNWFCRRCKGIATNIDWTTWNLCCNYIA